MQAGDVIGWVGNISSGALAFEQTANDTSFFYSRSKFSLSVGGLLAASGGASRYDIKHVLRAYVSQPSQSAVNVNFIGAGIHKVTAIVDNVAASVLMTCEVSVQVPCQSTLILVIRSFALVRIRSGRWLKMKVLSKKAPFDFLDARNNSFPLFYKPEYRVGVFSLRKYT